MAKPVNVPSEDIGIPEYQALFCDEERLTEAAPILRALVANASVSLQELYDFIRSIPIYKRHLAEKFKALRDPSIVIALAEVLLYCPLYEWCAVPESQQQDDACEVSLSTIHRKCIN